MTPLLMVRRGSSRSEQVRLRKTTYMYEQHITQYLSQKYLNPAALRSRLFTLRTAIARFACASLLAQSLYSEKFSNGFLFEIRLKYFSSLLARKARLFGVKSRFGVAAGNPCGDRLRYARFRKRAFPSENLAVSLPILLSGACALRGLSSATNSVKRNVCAQGLKKKCRA